MQIVDDTIAFDGGPQVRRRFFDRPDGSVMVVEPPPPPLVTGTRALNPDPNCGYGRVLAVRNDGQHGEMVCTMLSGVEMVEPLAGARALPSTIEASVLIDGIWHGVDITEAALSFDVVGLQQVVDGPDGAAAFLSVLAAKGIEVARVTDFECVAAISFYFGHLPDMGAGGRLVVSRKVTLTDILQCRADLQRSPTLEESLSIGPTP